jgi:predicted ATPase/DNA-binding winged helix-turn-helix (wHTH) protein
MMSIRLGPFELSAAERTLRRGGEPVELGARAFDLLLVLAENPGRLVSKATLLERVWPRLVVEENNLPAQVAALRRVLGAAAIRTVPGFGYRLELPVEADPGAGPADAPAADATPPPARPALAVPRRTRPERLAPLVGRDVDLAALEQALGRACLVTVIGGTGVGKTRLAQELLARLSAAGPVAWRSLASLDAVEQVPSAIAVALGLSLPAGGDPFVALADALGEAELLLILDGVEHLADALAAPLAALLAGAPGLRLLLTSQRPLGVAGETVYRLGALAVPDDDLPFELRAASPALALFAQRAAEADRGFALTAANAADVAAICRRLDGNPLALTLAAARVPALGVSQLLGHLDDRFRLLRQSVRGAEARHGALQAAFEWSYGLLDEREQRVFRRLGAFAGPFALDTGAHAVADETLDAPAALDLIGRLVDRSLVTALPIDPPRYTLAETARYYARDRLAAAGELDSARARAAAAVLRMLDAAYQEYWSVDEAIWLQRYYTEIANVRAAIDWAAEHEPPLAVALYGSAWPLYVELELLGESRSRFEQTVRLLVDGLPRRRVARFWEAVATGDSGRQYDRARYAAELAAKVLDEDGDRRARYYALMLLALNWRGDAPAARAAFEAARRLEDPDWPARLLTQGALAEGALSMSEARWAEAREAYRRGVHLALSVSERQALAATASIVELDLACGDVEAALQLGRPLAVSLGRLGRREPELEVLTTVFGAQLLAGDLVAARASGAEIYVLAQRLGPSAAAAALDAMALFAACDGRPEIAARVARCADASRAARGQARPRPTEERLGAALATRLDPGHGDDWRRPRPDEALLEPVAACALALGYRA